MEKHIFRSLVLFEMLHLFILLYIYIYYYLYSSCTFLFPLLLIYPFLLSLSPAFPFNWLFLPFPLPHPFLIWNPLSSVPLLSYPSLFPLPLPPFSLPPIHQTINIIYNSPIYTYIQYTDCWAWVQLSSLRHNWARSIWDLLVKSNRKIW